MANRIGDMQTLLAGIGRQFAGAAARLSRDLVEGRLVEGLAGCIPGDGEDIHALYSGQDRLAGYSIAARHQRLASRLHMALSLHPSRITL